MSAGETNKCAPIMPSLQYSKKIVNIILDDEFVTPRDCGFCRFLFKLYDRLDSDAIWIQEDDLHHLDPSLLDCYISSTIRSQVLFNLEGMMGHGVDSYIILDKIGSPNPIMIVIIINYLFNYTFWIYPLVFFGFIY